MIMISLFFAHKRQTGLAVKILLLQVSILVLLVNNQLNDGSQNQNHTFSSSSSSIYISAEEYAVSPQESAFVKLPPASLLTSPLHVPTRYSYDSQIYFPPETRTKVGAGTGTGAGAGTVSEGKHVDQDQDQDVATTRASCKPSQIHLALGDRQEVKSQAQDNTEMKMSMTLSFTIPFRLDSYCHPEEMELLISYGKLQLFEDYYMNMKTKTKIKDRYEGYNGDDNGDDGTRTLYFVSSNAHMTTVQRQSNSKGGLSIMKQRSKTTTHSSLYHGNYVDASGTAIIRQYNTTSPVTNEMYMSDFIYHVQLDGLDAATTYWYEISAQKAKAEDLMADGGASAEDDHEGSLSASSSSSSSWSTSSTTSSVQRHLRGGADADVEAQIRVKLKRTFTTSPLPTSSDQELQSKSKSARPPTKLAIVGDLGQTYNSTITMLNIMSEIEKDKAQSISISKSKSKSKHAFSDMILLVAGDLSYANSIQPQWDNWFQLMEPLTQQIPIMVAAGNHEIECDAKTFMPFLAYESRFYMPNQLGDAIIEPVDSDAYNHEWGCATPSVFEGHYDYGNAFYSFDHGMVRTIVLSSYSDTSVGSRQHTWMMEELKDAQQKRDEGFTPWIVVMMHTQFYTTFEGHAAEKETIDMKESMEDLFRDYGVNLVLSGHDHAYMRSNPMYKGKLDKSGKSPIYLIVGEGGNREGHNKAYLNPNPEDWVAVRDKSVYGFGLLEVKNSTTAHWRWNMDGKDEKDGFHDNVWLKNQFI